MTFRAKNGKLSVVMPVYNAGEHLRAAVESVLSQTYGNLELILVNDGSTDGSGEICAEYAAENIGRIKLINQKNAGVAGARNAGMRAADGEYIAFADNDDYLLPVMYETLIGEIERTSADAARCDARVAKERDISRNLPKTEEEAEIFAPKRHRGVMENETLDSGALLYDILQNVRRQAVWDTVWRRDVLAGLLFRVNRWEDCLFWADFISSGERTVCYSSKTLYIHFMRPESLSHSKDKRINDKNRNDACYAVYMAALLGACERLGREDGELVYSVYNSLRGRYMNIPAAYRAALPKEQRRDIAGKLYANRRLLRLDKSLNWRGRLYARLFILSAELRRRLGADGRF